MAEWGGGAGLDEYVAGVCVAVYESVLVYHLSEDID